MPRTIVQADLDRAFARLRARAARARRPLDGDHHGLRLRSIPALSRRDVDAETFRRLTREVGAL